MANCVFGFPNYVDADEFDVVLTGGDWDTPLENLKNPRLSLPARSNGLDPLATQFDVDLGTVRQIALAAIPSSNASLNAQKRLQITNIPSFSNDTIVGANGTVGDTSITFEAPAAADITVNANVFFTIGGFLYKAANTITITAGNTGIINLAPVSGNDIHNATLQADVTTGDKVRCNTGDYTTPAYDSTLVDIFDVIYPWGSLPWEHPSWWNGKITEEERKTIKFPVLDTLTDQTVIGQYARYEFVDPNNEQGDFAVSRVFLTAAWQPSLNLSYGTAIQYQTETNSDRSFGGEKSYNVKEPYRTLTFSIDNLDQDEMLVQALDMQRKQNLDKQIFFVFDPDDLPNLQRTSFTCTLQSLNPLTYAYFDHMAFNGILEEVLGGKLV